LHPFYGCEGKILFLALLFFYCDRQYKKNKKKLLMEKSDKKATKNKIRVPGEGFKILTDLPETAFLRQYSNTIPTPALGTI
tara:strand:- start:275 stop:517 length:243 start_codon:yes stop_codon:yes gene_type:complete